MNEVKIGFYGIYGHHIADQLPALKRARLIGIAGMDKEWLQQLQQKQPQVAAEARYYATLHELLASDADLIVFCSPRRDQQARQCIEALNAGKHVLAEKPLATTHADLQALRQAADRSGKEVRAMTTMVYDRRLVGMREVVRSAAIGTIVQIFAQKSYPYFEARPQDRGIDGGIMQAAIHAVSFVRFVTGLEFDEVFAQDTAAGNPQTGALQMAANLACRMTGGALTSIVCNYCNPGKIGFWGNDQLRIFGTGGVIELVDGFNRRMVVTNKHEPRDFPDMQPTTQYPQDLIDCILDDPPAPPTMMTQEDGFINTHVVLVAQESLRKGIPLKIKR